MNQEVPEVPRESARQSLFETASIVWLVPIAALLIAFGVAYSNWQDRGPLITINFDNASGVVSGETELRFRDVNVGVVERITFPETLDSVNVQVRVDKDIAPYVDQDAIFWIVRPEVTTSGISGLDTVLSGVYIQGLWDSEVSELAYDFEGLAQVPLAALGEDGLLIELRSSRDSGMTENTPILFKGIEVGRIGPASISADGRWVFADAIVFAPYDTLVTTATRFWDTSGFSFSLGASGAELDFSSVASLIAGGITFDTLVSGGRQVRNGSVFEIYPDEATARNSIFEESDGTVITMSVVFEDNVSGLTAGAPVEWRGVRVGEVANVTGLIDSERFGDDRVRLVATLEIRPSRFGLSGGATETEVFDYIEERVAEGLRARLVSASILTGGLKVEFLPVEDAEPARLERREGEPFPYIPTTESDVPDVAATAEGVFKRINELPIEDLLRAAIDFLDNASAVVASEDLREAPAELRAILSDLRNVTGSDDVQELPEELGAVMAAISEATEQLRSLLTTLEAEDGVARVLAAIDAAGAAAAEVEAAIEGAPALIERVTTLADTLQALPLDRLTAEATDLVAAADAIVNDPAAQALPADVQRAIAQVSEILTAAETEGTLARLSRTLDAATEAASAVDAATAGVPELVSSLEALSDKAGTLELETLVDEISRLSAAVRNIAESPDTQALSGAARSALAQIDVVLAQLVQEETISRLNEALASAREAAANVGASTEGVPALVERLQGLAAQLEGVPYDRLSTELADVLAEAEVLIRDATAAEIPANLSGALEELDLALSELRDGELIANANETLDSTSRAADAVARAADDLPTIVARLNTVLNQASVTLGDYNASSDFSRQLLQTLREIERAADAVDALSRALERRPNSIILGR